jgi:hypothetical protein
MLIAAKGDDTTQNPIGGNMKARIAALMAAMTFLAMLVIPVSRLTHGYTARNNKPAQEVDKLIHPGRLMVPLPALASGNQRPAGQAAPTAGCSGSGELSPGTTPDSGFHHCQVKKSGGFYLLTGFCLNERTCILDYDGTSCPEGAPVPKPTYVAACKTWDNPRGGCF